MNDEHSPAPGRFRYHVELTPAQLKITHTALHSLLDDFGHEQSDVHRVIREVLEKLPDDHAMRAVRLDEELERELKGEGGPAVLEPDPGEGPGGTAPGDGAGDDGPSAA